MGIKISNTTKFKMNLLTITLIINYCGSLYFALSSNTFGGFLKYTTLALSAFHALLYVFFNRTKRKILLWIMVYFVLFLAYRVSKRREVLDLYTMVSFYSNVEISIMNNKFLKTTICFFVIVVLFSLLHIIPLSPAFYRGEIYRNTLGFNHPNAGGYYSFLIAASLFIKDFKRKRRLTLIWLIILAIVPYVIFNCRTALIAILVIIFAYLINLIGLNVIKQLLKIKFIKLLLVFLVVGLAISLFYVSENLTSFLWLNNILSARLENNYLYLQNYNVHILGNAGVPTWISVYDGWGVRYLDSGYMQGLLCLGLINSIMYLYIFSSAMESSVRLGNIEVVVLLTIIGLMLLVEASPLRWYFSMPLLFQVSQSKKGKLFW